VANAVALLVFGVLVSQAAAVVTFCCANDPTNPTAQLVFLRCPLTANVSCGTTVSTGTLNFYNCFGSASTGIPCVSGNGTTCCTTDNCNCPSGPPAVHQTQQQVQDTINQMHSIMYPLLGIIFAVIWLIMAFFFSLLPHSLLLIINSICVFVFGIFLICLARTTMFGLYFCALGAFAIAVCRAKHSTGVAFAGLFAVLGFFMLTGTVFLVKAAGGIGDASLIADVASYIAACEGDHAIDIEKTVLASVLEFGHEMRKLVAHGCV